MSNPASKSRKPNDPYATWTDPHSGWHYRLLKSYRADNTIPYSRWFMHVEGFGTDLGDVYVKELLPGLLRAKVGDNLVIDAKVWASTDAFISWATGGHL